MGIRYFLVKPDVKIINGNELEIGYNTLGPILNLQMDFISDNKKSVN